MAKSMLIVVEQARMGVTLGGRHGDSASMTVDAGSGAIAALAANPRGPPRDSLTDIGVPDVDGMHLAACIRTASPGGRLIFASLLRGEARRAFAMASPGGLR